MQRPIRIRRVVYPLLVPRRLCIILHEWCKARFVPESLRYDINMISADPTVFYILRIRLSNVDFNMNLGLSKGQFSQQMTIAEENSIFEPRDFSN